MSGAHDLFWLAQYAHNTIQPAIDKINELDSEMKARLSVSIEFKSHTVLSNSVHVSVFAEPNGKLEIIENTAYGTRNKAGIDALVKRLETRLKADIEADLQQAAVRLTPVSELSAEKRRFTYIY